MKHLSENDIIAYIHQTMTDAQREASDRHLAACARCRAQLARHKQAQRHIQQALTADLRAVQPPVTLAYAEIKPKLERRDSLWMMSGQQLLGKLAPLAGLLLIALLISGLVTLFASFTTPERVATSPSDQAEAGPQPEITQTTQPPTLPPPPTSAPTDVPSQTMTPLLPDRGIQIDPQTAPVAGLQHLDRLGFGWVKFAMDWSMVEPQVGQYEWEAWDALIEGYHRGGAKILLTVARAPDWARPADDDRQSAGMPADPATYAAFVGQLAQRYQGKVQAIEIWQEQNIFYMVGGQDRINVDTYMALLRAAYQTIKAVDPTIVVVSGGLIPTVNLLPLTMDDVRYLQQMYEQGLKKTADAIGIHPAGYANAPDVRWSIDSERTGRGFDSHRSFFFMNTLEAYREVMVEFDDAQRQLWATDFGWVVARVADDRRFPFAGHNTLADQAAYTRRAFEIGEERIWVGPMFLANLDFAITQPESELSNFSIVTSDGPSPTYLALQQPGSIRPLLGTYIVRQVRPIPCQDEGSSQLHIRVLDEDGQGMGGVAVIIIWGIYPYERALVMTQTIDGQAGVIVHSMLEGKQYQVQIDRYYEAVVSDLTDTYQSSSCQSEADQQPYRTSFEIIFQYSSDPRAPWSLEQP